MVLKSPLGLGSEALFPSVHWAKIMGRIKNIKITIVLFLIFANLS